MSTTPSTANPTPAPAPTEHPAGSAPRDLPATPAVPLSPKAATPQEAKVSWQRRFSPWMAAGAVLVTAMVASAFIAGSSRAWAVVVILGGSGLALLVLQLTRIERRSDKRLEYTVVMLVSALAIVNTMNSILWQGWIKDQPPTSTALYTNHDLSRLVSNVIGTIMQQTVSDSATVISKPDQSALSEIAGIIADDEEPPFQWEMWMDAAFKNDRSAWRGIQQDALVEFIRDPKKPALTPETWQSYLVFVADELKKDRTLDTDALKPLEKPDRLGRKSAIDIAAARLCADFPRILRERLKHDASVGGEASKALVAMNLDISRELLTGMEDVRSSLGELLDDSPRLTLYHLRSADGGGRKEITPEYEGVLQNDALRVQTANVDGKHWYILTIDGAGEVGLYAPGELVIAENGLWSWQPTAPPTETVLLLVAAHELSGEERGKVIQSIRNIGGHPPALTSGQQIIWGEESGESSGWKVVEGGRGRPAPVARSGEQPWMTRVCEELRKINGLRFGGRTIAVSSGQPTS